MPGGGRASRRACGSRAASRSRPPCTRGWRPRGRPRGSRRRASRRARTRCSRAVPDSTVVIASTMSAQANRSRPVGVREGQRHRADLLDHRRRVAVGDARQLVAALSACRGRARARPSSGTGRRCRLRSSFVGVRKQMWRPMRPGRVSAGSSELDRHVAGADEVDLLAGAASAAAAAATACRSCCGTKNIASRNVLKRLGEEALAQNGGSSMPSITTSSWLSARPPPAAAHAAGER